MFCWLLIIAQGTVAKAVCKFTAPQFISFMEEQLIWLYLQIPSTTCQPQGNGKRVRTMKILKTMFKQSFCERDGSFMQLGYTYNTYFQEMMFETQGARPQDHQVKHFYNAFYLHQS